MSSSKSPEIIETKEILAELDDYQYEDDLSEDAILVTPFEVCPTSLGELSGRGDESFDANSLCEEEGETYSYMIKNARVRAAIKRPIQLCKYVGSPVCLMVLEIEFSETKRSRQMPRLLRFKSVEITAEFRDAEGKPKLGPEIVMFCPETYAGKPTFVLHRYSTTVKLTAGAPSAIPVGLRFEIDRTQSQQFQKSYHVSITGEAHRYGKRTPIVKWDVKEDEALKQGVPKQLRLVVAVKNPDQRAFNIKLNFSAYLGFNAVEFRVKNKESVLSTRVDPKLLREQALNDVHGPEHGRMWQCKADDKELTELMLEELTNLKGAMVGKTSA
ncbi:hypothetical protein V8E51_019791 [Hyaloscypha variabilis]